MKEYKGYDVTTKWLKDVLESSVKELTKTKKELKKYGKFITCK